MRDQEMRDRLLEAAALIDGVRSQLDVGQATCASCGVTHYSNWQAARLAQALEGIITKLRRFAASDAIIEG